MQNPPNSQIVTIIQRVSITKIMTLFSVSQIEKLSKSRACIQMYAAYSSWVNFHISAHVWWETLWRKTLRIWNYSVSTTERKFRKTRLEPSSTTKNEKKNKKKAAEKHPDFKPYLFIGITVLSLELIAAQYTPIKHFF